MPDLYNPSWVMLGAGMGGLTIAAYIGRDLIENPWNLRLDRLLTVQAVIWTSFLLILASGAPA